MAVAQSFEEAVSWLVSRVWEEDKTGRLCVSLCAGCAQHSCCGLITLHVGYNLLSILSILYAAKLMDTWKGLLEFVNFYSQLQHPWADSLLFVIGCTRYITRKDIMMVEFEKNQRHVDVQIIKESTLRLHYSGSKSFQFNNIKSMQLERTNWINVTSR